MGGKFIPFFSLDKDEEDPVLVIPALVEWSLLLEKLTPQKHGLDGIELAEVEAFCWYATVELMSAGFVASTADKRRFHLQCTLDATDWEIRILTAVQIGRDDPLPSPPIAGGPASMRWHTEVEPYNKELKQQRHEAFESAS